MSPYYEQQLEDALRFQDFVCKRLHTHGIVLQPMCSKESQIQEGENLFGMEIKYDKRLAETGNIYIETAEKSTASNNTFIASGIARIDNSWLYAIGDYSTLFIFTKKLLLTVNTRLGQALLSNLASPWTGVEYKEIATSKGFIIPRHLAEKWSAKVVEF